MNILKAILKDFISYFKPTSKLGVIRLVLVFVVLGVLAVVIFGNGKTEEAPVPQERGVNLASVAALSDSGSLELVGTVKAVDQATIQSEASGLVTSVQVELGQQVAAGTIIATLENDSEYAALLQAEGSYEAALANAAQSDFSVEKSQEALENAETSANTIYRSSFVTTESVLEETLASYFTIRNQVIFELQEDLGEKKQIEYALDDWQTATESTLITNTVGSALREAEAVVLQVTNLVDTVFAAVVKEENGADATELAELESLKTELTTARSSLSSARSSLESARLAVSDAESDLVRAEAAGTGGGASATDAAVKQALGSLRSAQATYNKTVLRTPVAGEVQVLNVDAGDFISLNTLVATVANQSALEITAYISQNESDRIAVGSEVELEDGATGIVTAIAPAVDPSTGKIAVKIASTDESLSNGDTVRLTIDSNGAVPEAINTPVVIPITALKVETDRTIVFTLDSSNILVAHPVETGSLLGSDIIIKNGLDSSMFIVTDARGFNEGDTVTVLSTA